MRDLIRKRILDWHYTGRGSLNDIVSSLLPSQYRLYRWSVYHRPDENRYILCGRLLDLSHEQVAGAFDTAARQHPMDSLCAVHFANQRM